MPEPHDLVDEGQHTAPNPVPHGDVESTEGESGLGTYPLDQVDGARATTDGQDAGEVTRRFGEGVPPGGHGVQQPVRGPRRRAADARAQALDEQLGEVRVPVRAV